MKALINHFAENWIKYGFETLVVVVGILVAFTLSNWNEERKIAAEEQAVLKLLLEDFENSKNYSQELIEREKKEASLLRIAIGPKEKADSLFRSPATDNPAKAVFWDFAHQAPVFRAYMGLKGSDQSSIIQSKELRKELTILEEQIHNLDYLLEDRRTVHSLRIDAIAAEKLNALYIIDNSDELIEIGEETDYVTLLQNQKVRNLIGIKLQLVNDILEARLTLHQQIEEVIIALQKEIK